MTVEWWIGCLMTVILIEVSFLGVSLRGLILRLKLRTVRTVQLNHLILHGRALVRSCPPGFGLLFLVVVELGAVSILEVFVLECSVAAELFEHFVTLFLESISLKKNN